MMLTEKDEFIYHEMIVHVPMAVHPNVRKVLVIGAGDGGCLRELTRYPEIEHIDVVEIDERVIAVCREWLPQTACGFDDPRVHIHIADGLKYVRKCVDEYDLIIVDSTDPFGPGEGLFTKEFYGNCFKALHADGIMVNQHESPFYKEDARAMQEAGAFAIVLECIPAKLAKELSEAIEIPTIGIGAGVGCDGQVQVVNDLLGLFTDFIPKHARRYANLSAEIERAFREYVDDVKNRRFPTDANSF